MNNRSLIVIGAGAGGMMAAGRAAEKGAEVRLLESMEQPGKKILISGKTRCNLTNAREIDDFITAYGSGGRFLYSAFYRFFREDLLDFLKKYGVETMTERGGRIFPVSGDAGDVVRAFKSYLSNVGVHLMTNTRVAGIQTENERVTGVRTSRGDYLAGGVILAAGGSSFPATGSAGDGCRLASSLGHTIVKLRPALVPLAVEEADLARSLQGFDLRNVRLTSYRGRTEDPAAEISDQPPGKEAGAAGKRVIRSLMGEMKFTHFGLAGQTTLQMSLAVVKALEEGPVSVTIDLKPALDIKQLQQRLQRDFDTHSKRALRNILKDLLPQKLIEPIISLSRIPGDKPGCRIAAQERDRLARRIKSLSFNIRGPLPISAAMVTAGGVSLAEIDPRTMASRLIKGLYFCGEVMDIDADTGGYNLQAAFSTGFIAGESAAEYLRSNG